jgi:hypothetical protein
MESANVKVCDWCKRPMLPEGGTISAKAKESIVQAQEEQKKKSDALPPPDDTEAEYVRPKTPPPVIPDVHEATGLLTLGANLEQEAEGDQVSVASTQASTNEELLIPLGVSETAPDSESGDLSASTMNYIGSDESIFRPIDRPAGQEGGIYSIDASGRKKRVGTATPEFSDNVRLRRSAPYGFGVAFLVAIVQFVVTKEVPTKIALQPLPGLGNGGSFMNALAFGFWSGILLGFMLAALLVNFKRGAVAGFLIGVVLGVGALGGGYWSIAAGALSGIMVGKAAVKGMKRRVVSV